jgi:predicted ATPase
LQTLVSRLRAALRGAGCDSVIESHPAGYRLAMPPQAVDALAFRALVADGRRALADGDPTGAVRVLREALSLWRGQPLADAAGTEFTDAAAIQLAELRDEATRDRVEAELELGAAAGLIGELKSMVSADPLADRPRALLMRALTAAGRQADALASYSEARELLADQLGVDPSPALEQVYLGILRGEQALAGIPGSLRPVPLPAPLTTFVGRDDELSRLVKQLRRAGRLITLTGPGGVGKTRLAIEVAGRLDTRAYFVPLAPVTDAAEVPDAVLDTLGVRGPVIGRRTGEPSPAADRLAAALADRDDVLILDNCEHVIEAVAELAARLLAGCSRIRILTTSREPLRIDGESLWPVPPLSFPPLADLEPSTYPAVRLLCDRAAAVRPGFEMDAGNAEAITRVCRVLDGMPLAIELAAVWLRVLSPAQLAERLDDRFALLTGGNRTALPRHQTLRAVVDWSWELLSEPERVLARRLSVFPDGATLAAAERVCAGEGLPAESVLAKLSGLVDKSILAVTEEPDSAGPRYRMLETVRAYCLERLAAAGEARQVRDVFAAYYLNLAETADPMLRGAAQRRWLAELTAEQDNIYAALRWLIASRDTGSALLFVRALGWYWMLRGQSGEPVTLAREVLALGPGRGDMRLAEARVICALMAAGPAWELEPVRADMDAAMAALAESTADADSLHPLATIAEPVVALLGNDSERALGLLDRFGTAADPWVRASSSMLRAAFGEMLGIATVTEDDLRGALAAFREMGESWGAAGVLLQLAQLAELRGDHATAIADLEEAALLGRRLGAWGDLPQIDGKLASVRIRMGDLAGARADLDRAERTDSTLGADRHDSAAWLAQVRAELCWREGDYEQADRMCARALSWLESQKSPWYQAMRASVLARRAAVAVDAGDHERARTLLAEALPAATVWMDHTVLADVVSVVAVFALGSADAELAATLLGVAHTIRSVFDEGGLDGPAVRQAARQALGLPAFEAAYQRGRELGGDLGVQLASDLVDAGVTADQVFRR